MKKLSHGVKNCHTRGVDSIVLRESPIMVRVFIANADHDLWKNHLPEPFSVGLHPHHCDIEIECIAGAIANVEPRLSVMGDSFKRYVFESVLLGGGGGFRYDDFFDYFNVTLNFLQPKERRSLAAEEMHTIYVPKGEPAAWIVREGMENPGFRPICYSNHDLTKWTAPGLYVPMTDGEVLAAVERLHLRGPK